MRAALARISLVIEARDIRVPLSCLNPELDRALAGRRRIIVYTKCDLVGDERRTKARLTNWHRDNNHSFATIFHADNTGAQWRRSRKLDTSTRRVLGAINSLREQIEDNGPLGTRALVVGMPNSGKSTLLNLLRSNGMAGQVRSGDKGSKTVRRDGKRVAVFKDAAKTAPQPGVTRKMSGPIRIMPRIRRPKVVSWETLRGEEKEKQVEEDEGEDEEEDEEEGYHYSSTGWGERNMDSSVNTNANYDTSGVAETTKRKQGREQQQQQHWVSDMDDQDAVGENEIVEDEGVLLLDTPGVFVPYITSATRMVKLALVNMIKDTIVDSHVVADYLLFRLNLLDPSVYARYCPHPTNDVEEWLGNIASRTGRLSRRGSPQLQHAAGWVLNQYRTGRMGRFVLDEVSRQTLEEAQRKLHEPSGLSVREAKAAMKEKRERAAKVNTDEQGF